MKTQGNILSQKENSNSSVTILKGMEYCGLNDEFQIAVVKNFNKLQENSGRPFNEIMNKINGKEFFTKENENIKKNQVNSGAEKFNE